MNTLRHSPLDSVHRELGAKMIEFGGWEMPLSYDSGTIAEHMACRSDSVAFDVSHLGTVRLSGPDAFERIQSTLTNDLSRISAGQAQYTHLLDDSGWVVDDIIVWWIDDELFDVMPNAANTSPVVDALGGRDVTGDRAIIAIQGRHAREKLATSFPEAVQTPRFGVRRFSFDGVECVAAGTGYTGEDGIELSVPAAIAPAVWKTVLGQGITPAGLGARDTLRLEAGLPLHGHDIGEGITPLQAGLGWVVAWDKGEFRGRSALERERDAGVSRRLRGFVTDGRQPPRQGNTIRHQGEDVGTVTSGNFSPVLGAGIALGLVRPDVRIGSTVEFDVRGRTLPARVVRLPFVDPRGK